MARYRINKHIAGAFMACAAALSAVGGAGYGIHSLISAPDSPETAEERRQSSILRGQIITYLPLAREMTVAAPAFEYPDSSQGSMNYTFGLADEIIDNATGIGDVEKRCEVLAYLRAVHRRAAENYLASKPSLPLPNLETHLDAARRTPPQVPLCQHQ